jgi:hypothetical protein
MNVSFDWRKISTPIKFIYAIFRLIADIETNFGRAVLNILKKQFPGQNIDIGPTTLGHRLMYVAKKQVQGNEQDAMDVIQNLLTYFIQSDWDFTKGTEGEPITDWKVALDNIFTNLRRRAITYSMSKKILRQHEMPLEEEFGKRPEEGGHPAGGEARIPDVPETALTESPIAKELDNRVAIKEFMDLIQEHLPDMRAYFSDETRELFNVIFEDAVGSFRDDIKENMNQASALKERAPDLYEQNKNRWSSYVNKLRTQLLDEIMRYIEDEMSYKDFLRLKEYFFAEAVPAEVRRIEKKKSEKKDEYQSDLDKRAYGRFKFMIDNNITLTEDEKSKFQKVQERLKAQGEDLAAIPLINPMEDDLEKYAKYKWQELHQGETHAGKTVEFPESHRKIYERLSEKLRRRGVKLNQITPIPPAKYR